MAVQPIVTFTPHLVPMNRGILSTAYCKLKSPMALPDLRACIETSTKVSDSSDSRKRPFRIRAISRALTIATSESTSILAQDRSLRWPHWIIL